MLKERILFPVLIIGCAFITACGQNQEAEKQVETEATATDKNEPHRYGGWYCPDNFGFVPVDIKNLDEVPAIAHRLPTKEELHTNMSLIDVDTAKYPDARALDMDLPRVASVYSEHKGMSELVIIIQAIVVQEDTVVGYRFVNGGNGSGWLRDVNFLTEDEVKGMGSQPFFYSKSVLKANSADIWKALSNTDYFKQLGKKFGKEEFFSSDWNPEGEAGLKLDTDSEKANGYVGMVYGNYYLQIDYNRKGFHYSEKLLLMENHEENTTEFFFASGPYPTDFEAQNKALDKWVADVTRMSER